MGPRNALDYNRLWPQRPLRSAPTRHHHYFLDSPISRISPRRRMVLRHAYAQISPLREVIYTEQWTVQHEGAHHHRRHGQRQCRW